MGRPTSQLYYCGRRRRWLYALVVTGGVTFMAVLPFVAERPTVFVAEANVLAPPGVAVPGEPDAATQLASTWSDALPVVVERVTGRAWSGFELTALADATKIVMGRGGKDGPPVVLSIGWRDGKTAEQLVRALAEELCNRKNREIPSQAVVGDEDASEERRCAEVLLDEARREWDELKRVVAEEEKIAPPVETPPPQPKTAAALVVNPAWGNLQRELLDLETQKSKLMEVYTEQHPRVAYLEAQRAELAERLAQTPQQIETGPTNDPREQPRLPIQPPLSPDAIAKRQRQAARLAELERAVADAERRVAEAVETERLAGSKQPASDQRWWVRSHTNAEARVADRASAPLGWLGMISVLAGSVVALGVVGIRPTYESAAEARALLSVPVVGVIPAEDPVTRPVSVRSWAAGLVGLAEWAVIAVAVLLAVMNWRQPGFAKKLLADPVTVLASPADWVYSRQG